MADSHVRPVLDGDDLATWASVATVLEWLPPALDAPLQRQHGMTHFEYGVLYALAGAPGRSLRMSVLAGYANSSLSRLSRAASRLEARGWTTRETDPADGRYTQAILTDEGLRRYELATPDHVENVRRLVIDVLTPAQRSQLRETNLSMLRAVRDGGEWPGLTQDPEAAAASSSS